VIIAIMLYVIIGLCSALVLMTVVGNVGTIGIDEFVVFLFCLFLWPIAIGMFFFAFLTRNKKP
jgi:phosphatidylglycerophosphatase A